LIAVPNSWSYIASQRDSDGGSKLTDAWDLSLLEAEQGLPIVWGWALRRPPGAGLICYIGIMQARRPRTIDALLIGQFVV
jgi:hypothetical protein